MTKKISFLGAALLAALSFAKLGHATGEPTSVTFDSFSQDEGKDGATLDGSVKFFFAGEGAHGQGDKLELHYSGKAKGKTYEDKCRWTMLGAFLQLQAKAKEDGYTKVVDITTASSAEDPDQVSGDRNKCLCAVNHWKSSSLIKYRFAK